MNLTTVKKITPTCQFFLKKGEETNFEKKKQRKYVKPNDFNQRPLLTDMKIS